MEPPVCEAAPPSPLRRLLKPVISQLKTGITPEKIALTVALGSALSIFPILGATTLLCGAAAFAFRLNQPVIQFVSYLIFPVQLALLIPFYRAGESLFGHAHVALSIPMLLERFRSAPRQFFEEFGMIGLQGIVVWVLAAPWLAGSIYIALRPPLRALARRSSSL